MTDTGDAEPSAPISRTPKNEARYRTYLDARRKTVRRYRVLMRFVHIPGPFMSAAVFMLTGDDRFAFTAIAWTMIAGWYAMSHRRWRAETDRRIRNLETKGWTDPPA